MHKSTLFIGALALGSACMGMPAQIRAQDVAQTPAPLFPVADHSDFPQPGATFEEVRRLILDRYYSDSIDEPSLYHAAILGMLRHISPPGSPDLAKLWSAEQYAAITNALQGISATIGIRSRFDQGDGSLTVTEVLPGSASEGSLRVRDRILRIDGEPLKNKTLDEINALLSGEDGSTVELTVVRDIEVLRLRVQREPFALQNLVSAMLPNATAYVRLRRVTQHASEELRAALRTHLSQGARRAIIDLRDNSGGVFTEGMRLAELFLPAKSVIVRTARRAEQVKTYISSNEAPFRLPLVLLVNAKTASASEIFVAALRAHGLAKVIGMPTFGKAIMEETFTLSNDYRVKFIVGSLYEPRGNSWQGGGLRPDIRVDLPAAELKRLEKLAPGDRVKRDPQLLAAWKILQ